MRNGFKIAVVIGLAAVFTASAQKKRTVWDGVYTADQATRGMATFKAQCASCHGENMMGGGGAPAAAGPEFVFNWKDKSVGELFEYVRTNMPPGAAGSISDQKYADIAAAIFQATEFPAGQAELPADATALADIQIIKEKP